MKWCSGVVVLWYCGDLVLLCYGGMVSVGYRDSDIACFLNRTRLPLHLIIAIDDAFLNLIQFFGQSHPLERFELLCK